MRLRHIEIFHAVFSNGSISAAARALNVSQPGVSKVLRHTEDQLGYKLFDRTKGKLIPTLEAELLFTEVDRVYQDINALARIARNLKNSKSGQIKMAAITGLAFDVLPRAISSFNEQYPKVSFEVQTEHYRRLESSIFELENDIGLAFRPPSHQGLDSFKLGNAEFACVFHKNLFPDAGKRIKIEDILDVDVITMNGRGPLGSLFFEKLSALEIVLNPRLIADTCFMAAKFVKHMGGATVVDEFTAKAQLDEELAYALFDPPIIFPVKALYLKSQSLSPLCEEFLEHLKDKFQAITDF